MPVALMNCIPVPADSDRDSLNTSAEQIRAVLTKRTAAIVVAHIAGHPCDMDPILELASERGIPIVEDCAQALGAVYKGRMVGSIGAIAAFSSMFGKQHCTGGQGGAVFTKNTLLFARARQVADRGKPHGAIGNPSNLIASLNFNQDEISMAIGRVQLAKLPGNIEIRRRFASLVTAGLQGVDSVSPISVLPDCVASPWFLMLRINCEVLGCDAREFASALLLEGIDGVQAGYPFYPTDHAWYRDAVAFGASGMPWSMIGESKPKQFPLPNVHAVNETIVRVDVHESLGQREANDLVNAIKKIVAYKKACR